MRAIYRIAALAGLSIASAALAGDTQFTPDAAATWSARTQLMAGIMDDAAAGTFSKASLSRVCNGLTGEQMKHEYGKEPRWALASQLEICAAFDGWAGKFGGSKGPCGTLKKGMNDLANATPATSPPEVVAAADALRQTVSVMLDAAKNNRGACRL